MCTAEKKCLVSFFFEAFSIWIETSKRIRLLLRIKMKDRFSFVYRWKTFFFLDKISRFMFCTILRPIDLWFISVLLIVCNFFLSFAFISIFRIWEKRKKEMQHFIKNFIWTTRKNNIKKIFQICFSIEWSMQKQLAF